MGEALIKGLQGQRLFVCESSLDRVRYLKKKYKITAAGITGAVSASSIVILAVKPQDMEPVLAQVKGNRLFISIAAGLTTKFFEKRLGEGARVVRAMPNMPALIGEGITGVCAGKYAVSADIKSAQKILAAIGRTIIVKEPMMDAVTAVSGSGPAYVFIFVEQWIAAAKALGLEEKHARNLVYETLVGSAHLLQQSEFSAGDLRARVTSKGGTTQAAMDVFLKGKFDQLMKQALLAAKNRAKELAQ